MYRIFITSILILLQIFCFTNLLAQYQFESCNEVSIPIVDNCQTELILRNKIVPSNGTESDSFNFHVYIDLWHDGTIDYDFITDPSQQTFGQVIELSKVSSLDEIALTVPELIAISCNDHRVYWNVFSDSGDTTSCVQDYNTIVDFSVISGDTIEHVHVNQGGLWVYLDDLDFSDVQFSDAVNQCDYEPTFFFESDNKVHPASGLHDYVCDPELFKNVNYHKIYFEFDEDCLIGIDSIVLKIYDQVTHYFGSFFQGTCSTLLNNTIGGLEIESENCELTISNAFINTCDLLLIENIDDFYSGLNAFNFSKNDETRRGLTTRDVLLMRKQILSGDSISSGFAFTGDYNNNGSISTLDQVLLLKTILLEDNYDFDVPWLFELDYASSDFFYQGSELNEFIISPDYFFTAQNVDDFGFLGYKKGDLDGSYYNTVYDVSPAYCDFNTYDSIEVQLGSRMISEGEEFTIPIMLNEDLQIAGLHFGLSSNLVTDIKLTSGVIELTDDFYNTVDSNFVAVWMRNDLNTYSYTRGDVLFTLTMTALSDFDLSDLFLDTPDFPREIYVDDNFWTLSLKMRDVGLSGISGLSDLDFSVYPNPFTDELFLQCGDLKLENLTLDVIDVNGRIVYQKKINSIIPNQQIPVVTDNLLAESIYFLRLTSEGRSTFKKIVGIK